VVASQLIRIQPTHIFYIQSLVKSRAHPNDRDRYANLVSQFMQLVVLLR